MLKVLGIIALVAIILIIAFFITKAVLWVKYGWPSKIPFYIIEFVTVDGKSNYFAVAYIIDGEYYRLKLRQFATYELAKKHVQSIVNTVNRYNKKKKLINVSHKVDSERLLSIYDIDVVPNWVIKFMNFSISSCFSKTSK